MPTLLDTLATVDDSAELLFKPSGSPIKAIGEAGSGRVGGYLVMWGDEDQKDLAGEYFSRDTNLGLDWYDRRPALYHHGLDGTMQAVKIGDIDTLKEDEIGVWAEAQLDLRNRYIQAVYQMVDKGILGWSSGTLPNARKVAPNGLIEVWPIVEGSLTPTPAEPRIIVSALKSALLDAQDTPKEPTAKEATPAQAASNTAIPEFEQVGSAPSADRSALHQRSNSIQNPNLTPPLTEAIKMDPNQLLQIALQTFVAQTGVELDEQQTQALMAAAQAALQEYMAQAEQAAAAQAAAAAPANGGAAVPPPPPPTPLELAQKALTDPAFLAKINGFVGQQIAAANGSRQAVETAVKGYAASLPGQSQVGAFTGQNQVQRPPLNVQVYSKFHGLDAKDMSFYMMFQNAKHQRLNLGPVPLDDKFLKELGEKANKAVTAKQLDSDPVINVAIKMWQAGVPAVGVKDLDAIKANELSHSTQTGFGDEWVPTLWNSDLWRRARADNRILPLFRTIEMPSNPFELPIEGADPTVYFVPETTAETELTLDASGSVIPDSKIASTKVTLTAKKLALRVGFSLELEEDSIIPVLSIYREQAERAIMDNIDYVLLNGDTETGGTGNINSDNGAPAATARYLVFDGLRKIGLVTDTTNRLDAANVAPTLAIIRRTRFLMAMAQAMRPADIAYIVGGEVYHKLLGIDEFLTLDKLGPNATVLTGEIGEIDSSPVIASAEMPLTESDGKVGTGTNDRGSLVAVYRPNHYVGYRRRISTSLTFLPYYDSYQLVSTIRLAFARQNNDSSPILYNIAV